MRWRQPCGHVDGTNKLLWHGTRCCWRGGVVWDQQGLAAVAATWLCSMLVGGRMNNGLLERRPAQKQQS